MFRIGELARHFGIKADTLRFYEKEGLLAPSLRTPAGYRLYSEEDKNRLHFILRCKRVGFSLKDIEELLSLRISSCQATCREVKAVADAKLADVEERIAELERFRHSLKQLSDACCGGLESAEHCSILEALDGRLPTAENNAR
ncbi:Zn(2+)-responsive transcriptional regulator [Zobellella denitrificans]|jgi:MerR family transcriptional regulator, Zn(II)-responsive regulator of zntA|uniref:Zinc-responsive transcriptional regulator n=1 Tax=Zobellella denitrificans TaxID=347534 RepID=A0A231MVU6_9GAMM|nr:Zn(2+)-responsive transcriptional regulator [Zobellella denitrificans]ATG75002.1 zinc-responsive transcriptional regulator [Zobellella denitrificans]OXS14361.1 Zn(2+)-responsive transcriptional regulator [Zobellella denitrificans]